jgi:hypothetical protein
MRFKYASSAKPLPVEAETRLSHVLEKCDVSDALVTSTVRTPEDQARIMYDNLTTHGVSAQRALYKPAFGGIIIDVYEHQKAMGATSDATKRAMAQKIIEIGPEHISAHCTADPTKCVFDVAPLSIPGDKKKAFINQVSVAVGLIKFLRPPMDPAFHIELRIG